MLVNITSVFLGFFVASFLDTTIGEFPSWAITGAASIVVSVELLNEAIYFYYYSIRRLKKNKGIEKILNAFNSLKLGIIYGLIVDAFKLGS